MTLAEQHLEIARQRARDEMARNPLLLRQDYVEPIQNNEPEPERHGIQLNLTDEETGIFLQSLEKEATRYAKLKASAHKLKTIETILSQVKDAAW